MRIHVVRRDATCSDNFSLRLFLVKMHSGGVSIRHATKRDIVKDSLVVRGRHGAGGGAFLSVYSNLVERSPIWFRVVDGSCLVEGSI